MLARWPSGPRPALESVSAAAMSAEREFHSSLASSTTGIRLELRAQNHIKSLDAGEEGSLAIKLSAGGSKEEVCKIWESSMPSTDELVKGLEIR